MGVSLRGKERSEGSGVWGMGRKVVLPVSLEGRERSRVALRVREALRDCFYAWEDPRSWFIIAIIRIILILLPSTALLLLFNILHPCS